MTKKKPLSIITKVGIVAAILFVAVPAVIWMAIKYVQFLAWTGGL